MPRLDDEGEALGATRSRSSPGTPDVLAKSTNETHENCLEDNPQANMNPFITRLGDVTSSFASPPARDTLVTNGGAKANPPGAPHANPDLMSDELVEEAANIAKLTKLVESVSSKAAGKILQIFWRKFLFSENDDEHLCWVLRAGLKNAHRSVIKRVLKDQKIINALAPSISKQEAIIKAVLNDTPHDQLLAHIPNAVLDQEICHRLKTMPAKPLIRWLAEAERLGFRENDIINDEDETVVPNLATVNSDILPSAMPSSHLPNLANLETRISEPDSTISVLESDLEMEDGEPSTLNVANMSRDSVPAVHEYNAAAGDQQQQHAAATVPNCTSGVPLMCPLCNLVFSSNSGYNYHLNKKICSRVPPRKGYKFLCENCGQNFTTRHGADYHANNGVCLGQDTAPATSPSTQATRQQTTLNPVPQQRKPGDVILPPQKQTFPTSHQVQNGPSQPPSSLRSEKSRTHPPSDSPIPRPPLQTPASSQNPPNSAHVSPPSERHEMTSSQPRLSLSELDPHALARLNKALADQELRFQKRCAGIDPSLEPAERAARLQTIKNGHATKKSQIRKSFNVTLRMGEKDKAARNANMTTPIPRPSLEGYRADLGRGAHGGGMTRAQRLSLDSGQPRVSSTNDPINNGHDGQGSQSMSQSSPATYKSQNHPTLGVDNDIAYFRPSSTPSFGEHPPPANKRQRTDDSDSELPIYTSSILPNRSQGQSLTAVGHRSSSQNRGSTESHEDGTGGAEINKQPTQVSHKATGSLMTNIEAITYSEDSSGGEDILSNVDRSAPNTQQGATMDAEQRPVKKRGTAVPTRGTFTAKRGRHHFRKPF